MSTDKIDLDERLYYLQSSTGQIWGRGAFRKRFWSRNSTGFDTSREPPNRFGHCIRLSRDKRTLRAMKRPAGPAGTRAAHKRGNDLEVGWLILRATRCMQREAAIAAYRTLTKHEKRALVHDRTTWAVHVAAVNRRINRGFDSSRWAHEVASPFGVRA